MIREYLNCNGPITKEKKNKKQALGLKRKMNLGLKMKKRGPFPLNCFSKSTHEENLQLLEA